MQHNRPSRYFHLDPSLPRARRVFEWFLILTLVSMGAAVISGLAAILWNGPRGGLTHSDMVLHGKTPVAFIFLCLAWWFCLSTFIARQQKPARPPLAPQAPAPAPLLLSLIESPKSTFLIAPVWAFLLTQLTSTVTWPVLRLNLSGSETVQLAHVEKLGHRRNFPKLNQHCPSFAQVILSQGMRLDQCLPPEVYNALRPGDGVQMTVLTHGDFMRIKALRLVPAADMPDVLPLDPDLRALLLRRAARDQRGTRAQ